MALCELCKQEQYPADTKVWLDEDGRRHFFCSWGHMEEWKAAAEAPEPVKKAASAAGEALNDHQDGEEVSEKAASEAARVLASAPKRRRKRTSP